MNDATIIVQRSPEWFAARCGHITASRMADLTAKIKSGPSASRKTYMGQLIAERLTGISQKNGFVNAPMQFGIDNEPAARAAYCLARDVDVIEVGYVPHPTIEMAGASPDGLIGKFGCVEIKVPNTTTHIETLLGGIVPEVYVKQMQWQMACAGDSVKWCDFVSFDPRMPSRYQLFVRRIERDNAMIAELSEAVKEANREIAAIIEQLEKIQ